MGSTVITAIESERKKVAILKTDRDEKKEKRYIAPRVLIFTQWLPASRIACGAHTRAEKGVGITREPAVFATRAWAPNYEILQVTGKLTGKLSGGRGYLPNRALCGQVGLKYPLIHQASVFPRLFSETLLGLDSVRRQRRSWG